MISVVTVPIIILDSLTLFIIFYVETATLIIFGVKSSVINLPFQLVVGGATVGEAGIVASLDAQVTRGPVLGTEIPPAVIVIIITTRLMCGVLALAVGYVRFALVIQLPKSATLTKAHDIRRAVLDLKLSRFVAREFLAKDLPVIVITMLCK